jgi:CubicO group peptidase (beta-lactamase class C family)
MNTAAFLVVLLVVSVLALGQDFDQTKLAQIPDRMQEMISANEIAGAVTCVVTRDKIVHLQAVGLADVTANKPMQTDNIFWIASMTKPLTGAAIVMLQEQGQLNIDDPVSKYIPEFADIKTPSGNPANLTIKHLLTHTSGLAEVSGKPAHTAKNLAELIPLFVTKPTLFEPGTQW